MTPAGTSPHALALAAVAASPRASDRVFPGRPDQVRAARRFLSAVLTGCPLADDAILCVSELASNSVLHSDSRKPGGTFIVRVQVRDGDYVHVEVEDNGGAWPEPARRNSRPHGLDIVRELADDWARDGDAVTGWVVWARLDWRA